MLATGTHMGTPGASPGHPMKTKSFPLCLVLPCLQPYAPGGKHPPSPHRVKSWCFEHFQLHPQALANQPGASGSCTWQDSSTVPPLTSVPLGPFLSLSPRQQCHGVNITREPCMGTPRAAVSGPAGRAMLTGPCRAIAPANQFVGTPLTN